MPHRIVKFYLGNPDVTRVTTTRIDPAGYRNRLRVARGRTYNVVERHNFATFTSKWNSSDIRSRIAGRQSLIDIQSDQYV